MPNTLFYTNPPPRLPMEQVFFYTHFESDQRLVKNAGPYGSIGIVAEGLEVDSGASDTSDTETHIYNPLSNYPQTWDKHREIKFTFKLEMDNSEFGEGFIGCGNFTTGPYIGVAIRNQEVLGVCHDGTSESDTTIQLLDPGAIEQEYLIHLKHYPTARIEVYENDNLQGTIETNLPSGLTYANYPFQVVVTPGDDGLTLYTVRITCGYYELIQDK